MIEDVKHFRAKLKIQMFASSAVSFLSEASKLDSPGPFNVSRLKLPYVPGCGKNEGVGIEILLRAARG